MGLDRNIPSVDHKRASEYSSSGGGCYYVTREYLPGSVILDTLFQLPQKLQRADDQPKNKLQDAPYVLLCKVVYSPGTLAQEAGRKAAFRASWLSERGKKQGSILDSGKFYCITTFKTSYSSSEVALREK